MWELEVQERKIGYDQVPLADRRLRGLDSHVPLMNGDPLAGPVDEYREF